MPDGNLYNVSPFVSRETNWRCRHGRTGRDWMMRWKGCWRCALNDPWLWLQWRFPALRRFGALDVPPREMVWFYIAVAISTFAFQAIVRADQCITVAACAITMSKAAVWSAAWIVYWPVYVAVAAK